MTDEEARAIDMAIARSMRGKLCSDCPPASFPEAPTRCLPCPRRPKAESIQEEEVMDAGTAYHLNGLREWKRERQKGHRMLMARYASLERQSHPCLRAQGALMALNARFLEMIDAEIAALKEQP